VPASPALPTTTEQPSDTKLSDTKPLGDGRLADSSGPDTLKPAEGKPSATTRPGGTKGAMVAATTSKVIAAPKAAVKTVKATGRQWYVQVGAFKDAATAKNVAAKLREDNYKVDDDSSRAGGVATVGKTTIASPSDSGDQYDVIITGQSLDEINKHLAAKGLSAEAAGTGAVVKPSLPLRDAVALSKDLAVDGLKVQVRRTGGSTPTAARTSNGDALHRVSVGGFPDKATAMATLKELEGKGYKPFLTRR
jgi:cell division septation protein DedD